jgi:hypothetical protein
VVNRLSLCKVTSKKNILGRKLIATNRRLDGTTLGFDDGIKLVLCWSET